MINLCLPLCYLYFCSIAWFKSLCCGQKLTCIASGPLFVQNINRNFFNYYHRAASDLLTVSIEGLNVPDCCKKFPLVKLSTVSYTLLSSEVTSFRVSLDNVLGLICDEIRYLCSILNSIRSLQGFMQSLEMQYELWKHTFIITENKVGKVFPIPPDSVGHKSNISCVNLVQIPTAPV